MANDPAMLQALLFSIRERFLDELAERCDGFENLILALEDAPADRETFSFAIIGRELQELNGIAVIAALRASRSANHDIPVVLVTSSRDTLPELARVSSILPRDQHLAEGLVRVLQPVLAA